METEAGSGLAPEMTIHLVVFLRGWRALAATEAQRGYVMYLASCAQPVAEPEAEPRPSDSQARALPAPCTPASEWRAAFGQEVGSSLVAGAATRRALPWPTFLGGVAPAQGILEVTSQARFCSSGETRPSPFP